MEKLKIKDIVTDKKYSVVDGPFGTQLHADEYVDSGIPLIRVKNIGWGPFLADDLKFITEEKAIEIKRSTVFPGDIVLAKTGATIGKTCIFPEKFEKAIIASSCAKISLDPEKAISGYVYRYLLSPDGYAQIIGQSAGSTRTTIGLTGINNLEIPLPPLDQQKKIAAILDTADAYRQKTKALIEKYDELTQSLFLDMFGDPVTNPKGWEIKSFEEMVSDDCPLTYGIVQPGDEVSDGVPCVRPVDLTQQYVSVDNLKRIDLSISQKFKRTLLKGGEILLSVRGSVGVISIADSSLANSNVTRGIVPIWFDKNVSSKLFFYYLYKSLPIQRKLSELAKGATLIQLNLKDLRELNLVKPPLDLQNQFAERVQAIEAQKAQAQASLAQAEDLFNSLLQKAFKGELV